MLVRHQLRAGGHLDPDHVRTGFCRVDSQVETPGMASSGEEEAVGLTKIAPILVEDEMLKLGAIFSKGQLGGSRRQRPPADHGTEPAFLVPSREDPAGDAETNGQIGSHVRSYGSRSR
jgi:hypothetical protein